VYDIEDIDDPEGGLWGLGSAQV